MHRSSLKKRILALLLAMLLASQAFAAELADVTAPVMDSGTAEESVLPDPSNMPASEVSVIYSDNFEAPFSADGVPSGWKKTGTQFAGASSEKNASDNGAQSLHITDISQEEGAGAEISSVPAVPGVTYTFSVKALLVSGRASVYVKFFDSNGKSIPTGVPSTKITEPTGEWVVVENSVTAPENAVTLGMTLTVDKVNVGDVYFDDVEITGPKDMPEPPPEVTVIYSDGFEAPFSVDGVPSGWKRSGTQSVSASDKNISDGGMQSFCIEDLSIEENAGAEISTIPAVPGVTYNFSVKVLLETGKCSVYTKFYDKAGKQISSEPSITLDAPSGDWVLVEKQLTAPANAAYLGMALTINKTHTGKAYFDDVLITGPKDMPEPPDPVDPPTIIEPLPGLGVIFEDTFETPFIDATSNTGKTYQIPSDNWLLYGCEIEGVDVGLSANNHTAGGSQSFYVKDTTEEGGGGIQSLNIRAEPGYIYDFEVQVLVKSGSCHMFARYLDADFKSIKSQMYEAKADPENPNQWQTLSCSLPAPDNTAYLLTFLVVNKVPTCEVYFDDMKITKREIEQEGSVEGVGVPPTQGDPGTSQLVTPVDGALYYSPYNEQGDTLSDFSQAGFYGGEVELPVLSDLPVIAVVSPSADPNEDDTQRLQQIIDEAAAKIPEGEMAVVKLEAGTYNISSAGLYIRSGIVLAGSGQGENGTILYAKDPVKTSTVRIAGTEPVEIGEKAYLTDTYVKAGSCQIHLSEADAARFQVGDLIRITHPSDHAWCDALGMSGITSGAGVDTSWDGKVDMTTERIITAINGTEITVNLPFYIPYDTSLSRCYVTKLNDDGRVKNFGIENLRLVSYYNGQPFDEEHASTAIHISYARDGYVRNISAKHYINNAVICSKGAKQITVQNSSYLDPISQVAGSRRYSFAAAYSAQQILFTGCYSYSGRHDFETSYPANGPIVFLDNVGDSTNNASETHGTWSTGVLYDNLYQVNNMSKGFIALPNHAAYGTSLSQGWGAAGSIVWNSLASTIIGHKPYGTYQNFLIGAWGVYGDAFSQIQKQSNIAAYSPKYRTATQPLALPENFATHEGTPFVGDCYKELDSVPVEPRSLFKAQLSLRLNGDYRLTKPNAPIIVTPRAEAAVENGQFTVSGIYQKGAERVTIYVNDIPYDAVLDATTNTFKAVIPFENAYVKVYATQTINGIESTKNADRFISIGNPGDLSLLQPQQSIYSTAQTSLLVSDPRPVFKNDQQGGGTDPTPPYIPPYYPENPKEPTDPQPCDGGANCPSRTFADLQVNAWYHEVVDYALTSGLMSGTAPNMFQPNEPITRAMLAQVLYNQAGRPSVEYKSSYADVDSNAWYAPAVAWATEAGLVSGYGNGIFGPSDYVTREQIATILWRQSGSPVSEYDLSAFADSSAVSSYALDAMRYACKQGIIEGRDGHLLSPGSNVTRAEVCAMFMRLSAQ